jgi:DNA gyrase/topoisomerase IV subunit A
MTYVGIFEEVEKEAENKKLKKRIKELEGINKDHQRLNGSLRKEIEDTKKEHDQLMMNKITKYEQKIKQLNTDIDRLSEERDNFEILAKSKAT